MKLLQNKTYENTYLTWVLAKFFWIWHLKHKQNINKQVGLHYTEKFLYSKRKNEQSKKTAYRTGKSIFKPYIWYYIQNI